MAKAELLGSREALLALFVPMFLPHGSHFQLTGKQRREARQKRLKNWQWRRRRAASKAALERYGYEADVVGKDGIHFSSPEMRRLMRNARKKERRVAVRGMRKAVRR